MMETLAGDQNEFHVGKLVDSFTLYIVMSWQALQCTCHFDKGIKQALKQVIKQALKTVQNMAVLELYN